MNRLEKYNEAVSATGIATGVLLAQKAGAWLENNIPTSWLPIIVAILIVGLSSQLIKYSLSGVFRSSRFLRRAILRSQYVEGAWFDKLSSAQGPAGFGNSRIEIIGSSIIFSGEDYNFDCTNPGHFKADLIAFDFPKIKYTYTYHRADNPELSSQGYGEVQFMDYSDGIPKRYDGYFFDLKEGKRMTYESFRIEDKNTLSKLKEPSTRLSTLQEFSRRALNH